MSDKYNSTTYDTNKITLNLNPSSYRLLGFLKDTIFVHTVHQCLAVSGGDWRCLAVSGSVLAV